MKGSFANSRIGKRKGNRGEELSVLGGDAKKKDNLERGREGTIGPGVAYGPRSGNPINSRLGGRIKAVFLARFNYTRRREVLGLGHGYQKLKVRHRPRPYLNGGGGGQR